MKGDVLDRAVRTARSLLRRHWGFGLLLAAGLLLRVVVQVSYQPALLFIDSVKYLFGTQTGTATLGAYDPIGYTLLVLAPLTKVADLAYVALLQHLAGVAMAAGLYALMLRRGVTRWLATLAVAPVLLDAYQLNAEQTIMPDVLFEVLLVAGIMLLLWRPRPGLVLIILSGLALGASGPVRQVGEALIVPALVYVVAAAPGWRTKLKHGLAMTVCFALPVVGYMTYSAVILHYGFELSNMGDAYLYGRTAHAADCATLKIPAIEQPLCPSAPASAALGVDGLVNAQDAPRVLYQPVDVYRGELIDTMPLQRALADSVLRQQPMRVAGDIASRCREALRADQEHRPGRHAGLPLAVPDQLPVLPGRHLPARPEQREPHLLLGWRGREPAGQCDGRHRVAVLPDAWRVHAGTGVPARAAGRDRRDRHLAAARLWSRAGLPADYRVRGGRAARRGPVRVLLALPAARPGHAAGSGGVRRHRASPDGPDGPGTAAQAGGARDGC